MRTVVKRVSPVWFLIAAYLALTILTLLVWGARGVYTPTGDEPHYLVMADSLTVDQSWELSEAYLREFESRKFYASGLSDLGVDSRAQLGPPAAHVIPTAEGNVSWHGWGVAGLASLVLPWGGVFAVRMVMALAGVVVILAAWKLSQRWSMSQVQRSALVAAVAIAYPALLAGGQIFPDLWAGALALIGIVWLLTPSWRMSVPASAAVGVSLGALPWLGVKFAVAAAVLVVAAALAVLRQERAEGRTALAALGIPALALFALLAGYHLWAFGSVLGPPVQGALVFGTEFWMLLPGLLMDQNQGFLFYNPVLFLALPGVVLLWRSARMGAVTWMVVFASNWIPSAAHPGLYGLGSFNGRYSWALACLAIVPTVFALAWLGRRSRYAFWATVTLSVGFQAYLYALGTFLSGSSVGGALGLDFYAKPMGTWLETYSAWWFPLQGFLPAWYNSEWAFAFGPNIAWLIIIVLVVVAGVLVGMVGFVQKSLVVGGVVAAAVSIVVVGAVSAPGDRSEVEVVTVQLMAGRESAGFVADGALRAMRLGPYTWGVAYTADGSGPVGKWEVVRGLDGAVVAAGEINGSQGAPTWTGSVLAYRSFIPQEYLLRVGWYGSEDMEISALTVAHGDRTNAYTAR